MSFSFSLAIVACPSCGAMVMPGGTQFGNEPDHLAAGCDHCKKTIEVTRNPTTGKIEINKTKKH